MLLKLLLTDWKVLRGKDMEIAQVKSATKRIVSKRLGRGTGSGRGKTSGRGNKGAGQRAGQVTPYPGFQGGNIPFFRKIPKRGFTSPNGVQFQVVNLVDIDARMKDASLIDPDSLLKVNLIRDAKKPVKILAKIKGAFSVKANFKVDRISAKAKQIIEECGGTIEFLSR